MGKTYFDQVQARQFIGPGSSSLPSTTGNYYWVSSTHTMANNGNAGTDPDYPLATINGARAKCTADHGDVIIAMPGHVEPITSAGALALSVSGVTVFFMGEGESKATLDFSTVVGASMTVTANGVTFLNSPRCTASIDGLTGPISVTASDFKVDHFDWYDSTDMNTTNCLVASSAADRIYIGGAKFFKSNEGGTQKQSFIKIGAVADPVIGHLDVVGDFSDAPLYNNVAWARARLGKSTLNNTNAGPALGIKLSAASSGVAEDVNIRVASGVLFVSAVNQMNWNNCYGVNADGEYQSVQIGDVTDYAHDPALGANNADNAFDSTNTVSNPDGSLIERAEYIQSSIGAGLGAAVAAIQTDLGNPSARTNLKTIEAMLGNPDTAGATIYDAIGSAAGLVSYPAAAAAGDGVSVAEVVRYIQETQLGTLVNTGGTATVGGILGDFANVAAVTRFANVQTEVDKLGTPVNTGGTAKFTNLFGDMANVPAVTRFANIQTEVDKIGTIVNTGGTATIGGVLGDVANVSVATNLAKIGTITNTGGTATLGGVLGDVANVSVATRLGNIETETDQIGTVVNTGGTATLAGILGDFANVTAVTKFANIQTEVDKIGTLVNTGGTAELGAMLGDFANISLVTRLGVPVTSVSADIAAVQTEVDKIGTIVNTGGTATLGGVLGDVANVSVATNLAKIGTIVNTGGTATLGGVLGDVANTSIATRLTNIESKIDTVDNYIDTEVADIKTETDQIGTVVNTGGTATLAGILGDFANVTAVTKFTNIQSAVDAIQTDLGNPSARTFSQTIQAMLGNEDTEDKQTIWGALAGADGIPTFPAAAAAANGVSMAKVLRYISEQQVPRIATKTYADLTGYDTAASFTVTGDVKAKVYGVVGAVAITSTSGTTTLSVGTTEAPQGLLANSTVDNAQFAATDVWVDSSPADDCEVMPAAGWVIIGGGADIMLTRSADDLTAGTLTLYCEYIPLSSGATVEAA